jgi:hypothetical protein
MPSYQDNIRVLLYEGIRHGTTDATATTCNKYNLPVK